MTRRTLTLALAGMVAVVTAACSDEESVNEVSSLTTVEVTRGDLSICLLYTSPSPRDRG